MLSDTWFKKVLIVFDYLKCFQHTLAHLVQELVLRIDDQMDS